MGYVEALRAIWILIFSERWSDLQEVGLCREETEKATKSFIQKMGGIADPPTGPELLASALLVQGFSEAADKLLKKYRKATKRGTQKQLHQSKKAAPKRAKRVLEDRANPQRSTGLCTVEVGEEGAAQKVQRGNTANRRKA